jgi:hypothetical protein
MNAIDTLASYAIDLGAKLDHATVAELAEFDDDEVWVLNPYREPPGDIMLPSIIDAAIILAVIRCS